MKKILKPLFLGLIFTFYSISNCLFAQNNLHKEQILEDLDIFQTSLRNNHPQLFLYSSRQKLDSFFIDTKAKIKGDMLPIDFYRILTPVLPIIGNNHTNIVPPKSFIESNLAEAKRFPFSLFSQNDSLYVLEDASKEYVIKEGSIINAINGMDANSIIQTFLSNITTDGNNRTQPLYGASRGFSRYFAYYFGFPMVFDIEYVDSGGNSSKTAIKAITTDQIAENRKSKKETPSNNLNDLAFEVIDEIGVLSVKTFSPSKPKLFKKFLGETFEEIRSKGINKLIIDLRDNMGGYPEVSNQLLTYLIKEDVSPYRLEYAITDKVYNLQYFEDDIYLKHFSRLKLIEKEGRYNVKGAVDTKLKPNKYNYAGKLYILMNANSSSTTGQLIGLLKTYTDALFVGEESGGNPVGIVANDILTLTLPNSNIEVKLPVIYSELNVDFDNKGRGILPDKEIKPTIEELLSGKDAVLEKTLNWISIKEKY